MRSAQRAQFCFWSLTWLGLLGPAVPLAALSRISRSALKPDSQDTRYYDFIYVHGMGKAAVERHSIIKHKTHGSVVTHTWQLYPLGSFTLCTQFNFNKLWFFSTINHIVPLECTIHSQSWFSQNLRAESHWLSLNSQGFQTILSSLSFLQLV